MCVCMCVLYALPTFYNIRMFHPKHLVIAVKINRFVNYRHRFNAKYLRKASLLRNEILFSTSLNYKNSIWQLIFANIFTFTCLSEK